MGSGASVQYSLNYNDIPIQGINRDYFEQKIVKYSLPSSLFASYCDSDGIIERDKFIALTKATDVYLMYDADGVDDHGRVISERVNIINEYLRKMGLVTWIYTDHDKIGDNLLCMRRCIEEGISNTQCVLVFISKRLLQKVTDPADSVQLDLSLLNSNIEEVGEEKRMQEMATAANVVTNKSRKTIIRSTVIEEIPVSSGALSQKTVPYIPVDNFLKFEFNYSFKVKTAQLMIPVILEEPLRHPQSWGACVEDVLGCRLAINCCNFEDCPASLKSLHDLIIARIKIPLLKGGNFDLDLTKYTIKGRHLHWLKSYTSLDKSIRGRYADLFAAHGVDSIMSFLTPLSFNSNYLVDKFQMPRDHSDAIYQALQRHAYDACRATHQVEIVKTIKKQNDAWMHNENIALAAVHKSKLILSSNEEIECMSHEDMLSRSLRVESQVCDVKQRISIHETIRITEEGVNIERFDEHRILMRNEKEFINYREAQVRRRKQLVNMAIKVDNIVAVGVCVRLVSEKVARYFAGLPVDKFSYEELKCTRQEVLEDAAAVFIMLNRLMTSAGGFANFQAELLHAGLLMHILGIVHNCSGYSDTVQMIKSEEFCEEYCSLPPVLTDSNHYVCTAIENGLLCISLACRPSRYSREYINVDTITLLSYSGIIPVVVAAISANIHIESIVCGAVECLSSVTCKPASFGKEVLEPLSGVTAENVLTPSRSEHIDVVFSLLTCLANVLQEYMHCPSIVGHCAEVIVAIVPFDIFVELSTYGVVIEATHTRAMPSGTVTTISGILLLKRIFKLLVKCCKVMVTYDQNTMEWLLYCLNTFAIIHNGRHSSMQQCRAIVTFVTEYYSKTGLCVAIIRACPILISQPSILELAFVLLGNLVANNSSNVVYMYDACAITVSVPIIREHYLKNVRVASAGYYFLNQLISNISSESGDFLLHLQRNLIQSMLENGVFETVLFPCTLGGLRMMKICRVDAEEPSTNDLIDMYVSSFHVVASVVKFSDFTTQSRIISIGICEKIVDVLECHGHSSRALFDVCCDTIAALANVNVALGTRSRFRKCGTSRILYDLWNKYGSIRKSYEKGIKVVYLLSHEVDALEIVKEFTSFGIKAFLTSKRHWICNISETVQRTHNAAYVSFLRDVKCVSLGDACANNIYATDQEPVNYKQKLYIVYSIALDE